LNFTTTKGSAPVLSGNFIRNILTLVRHNAELQRRMKISLKDLTSFVVKLGKTDDRRLRQGRIATKLQEPS
jgi:hypothetical protein